MSAYTPVPGDIGLYRIPGRVGFAVALGQWLLGDGFKSKTHTFIVATEGRVFAAQPGGAKYESLQYYIDRGAVFTAGPVVPTQEQRDSILAECEKLRGTPYSYLDYLAIACHHFRIRFGFIEDYVQDSGHMICSQLDDEVYRRARIHLFNDGRLAQYVTPGAIDNAYTKEK